MFADWALPYVAVLAICLTIALLILPPRDRHDDE